jgi:hypothetical protein
VVHAPARFFGQQNAEVDFAAFKLALRSQAQQIHLFCHQFARRSRLNIQHQRAIRHTANLFHAMSDLFKHLSQLAVAAFDQNNLVPGIFPGPHHADASRRGANASLSGLALGNRHTAA